MEPEASELPKNLVLGRDENIHIRLTGSTALDDVGSYIICPEHTSNAKYTREFKIESAITTDTEAKRK